MQKPFYSKWWFWGIAALVIIAVVGGKNSGQKEEVKSASTEPKQEIKQETKKENTKPEVKKAAPMKEEKKEGNKEGISKAEFDQIQNGMTYEEVKEIIGSDGEIMSESGQKGQQFYTIMYSWKGEQGFGANANFMFQEDKLQNKAQFGLQ
ncbi:DUF3862 domain-containing protein [Bacillus cereus]|uniref:DUF3862 domain-containing protein n=1 Tax=Bacillus thuringiensis TaxID=1428 RepID=UPI002E9ECD0B|nr:DUF3862 domain-containing protein [Bacillus cereus]